MNFFNAYNRRLLCVATLASFFCVSAVGGEIPVKDKDTKKAVKDVKDAVKDNTDFLREATEALATTISGGLVAQTEGLNSSIGNMSNQVVAAINRQARVSEKIKTQRLFDPGIADIAPGSCGRANVIATAKELSNQTATTAKSLQDSSVTHHKTTSALESEGDTMLNDSSRVLALSDESNGLIEVRGLTRSPTTDGSMTEDDRLTRSRVDTLVNPYPATGNNVMGKTSTSLAVAAIYNSKKLVASDILSDILADRTAVVEVTDPHVLSWVTSAGASSVDGVVSMSPESYRMIKNTYRRQSSDWIEQTEIAADPIVILRDLAMTMAQELENQEEIIQLLTKSLSIQALTYSQLVDNQGFDDSGGPRTQ